MHTLQPPRRPRRFLLAATEEEHAHLGAPWVLDAAVASHLVRLPFRCCTAMQGFPAGMHPVHPRHTHCVLWMQPVRPRFFRAPHAGAPPTSPYCAAAGTTAAAQSAAEHKTTAQAPREGRRGRRGRSRGGGPPTMPTARGASPGRPSAPPAPALCPPARAIDARGAGPLWLRPARGPGPAGASGATHSA